MIVKGRAWTFGTNINTDLIFPKTFFRPTYEPGEMATHLMAGIDPDFASKVKPGGARQPFLRVSATTVVNIPPRT